MLKRFQVSWERIWELRADPTDQWIIAGIYFTLAFLSYLRPAGRIFDQLATLDISPYEMAGVLLLFSGLSFRRYAVRLLYFLLLLVPSLALVSYIVWFIIVTPDTSFLTTTLAAGFLIVIVKNSFTVKRVRRNADH